MRFPLILLVVIILSYLVFEPRVLHYLLPSTRGASIESLLNDTRTHNHLNPQKYWETREFYYPGLFYVYQDGLTDGQIVSFESQTGIDLDLPGTFPILVYASPKWQSYEALVTSDNLDKLATIVSGETIYQDKETKIIQSGDYTYFYFLKSYDELKVTNGFIYTKEEILKNYRYWFAISVVTR